MLRLLLFSLKDAVAGSTYRKIYEMSRSSPVVTKQSDALSLVRATKRFAFISDFTSLYTAQRMNCSQYKVLPELFNVAGFGWILPKGAYFAKKFDYMYALQRNTSSS